MKIFHLVVVVMSLMLVGGCSGAGKTASGPPREVPVVQATEADTILVCLNSNEKLSRKDFVAAYKTAKDEASRAENADKLRLVCLGLNQQASYKQFKEGLEVLSRYIKEHPAATPALQGLMTLMQRIDREKIVKWAQSSKRMDEKEGLEAENRELQERNEMLERSAAQDQVRIKELQQQIEQLKNIESIIKNRER